MTLKALISKIEYDLTPAVGSGEARAMASVIVQEVLMTTRVDAVLNAGKIVEPESVGKVEKIVSRVIGGEPLQYVLGFADFHGLKLKVNPAVLIPRPETSALIDLVTDKYGRQADLEILDVCTGSGAIAVALARNLPFPHITAIDISEAALEVAKENCRLTDVKNVKLLESDVLTEDLPSGPFDIIISNPPYVDNSEKAEMDSRVVDREPAIALFVPDDIPLIFYKRIAEQAKTLLKMSGSLYFEINPRHADDIARLLQAQGFDDVEIIKDYTGRRRYAVAKQIQP